MADKRIVPRAGRISLKSGAATLSFGEIRQVFFTCRPGTFASQIATALTVTTHAAVVGTGADPGLSRDGQMTLRIDRSKWQPYSSSSPTTSASG